MRLVSVAPHKRVAADLRHRIDTGELRPGDAIPSRARIAETYGVTLGQAQVAVALLQDEGIVVGIRRSRVIVADPAPVRVMTDPAAPWPHGAESHGATAHEAGRELAALLAVDDGALLVRHRDELLDPDGRPSHLQDRYTVSGTPVRRRVTYERAVVSARLPTGEERQLLGIPNTAAVLVIRRVGAAGPRPVEVVDLILPTDRWMVARA